MSNSLIESPAQRLGELYREVQLRELFEDGKVFADAQALRPVPLLLSEFQACSGWTDKALRGWVEARFRLPEPTTSSIATAREPMIEHIRALWPRLTREATEVAPGSSLISLPRPYVAPGGRFRELYYWDTFFTMLGLGLDGREDLVEAMLDNFVSLMRRFGHIPNGTRDYYIGRSQPPMFHLMVRLSNQKEASVQAERLEALQAEHAFWMHGGEQLEPGEAFAHVVALPDGALLNRYFDVHDTPRDEAYRKDVDTAAGSDRPPAEVFRDLRAGAESGWDFSSRWLLADGGLETIRTTAIAPVDLNSLLWSLERTLAELCTGVGRSEDAERYCRAATARLTTMRRWCVDPGSGIFCDVTWGDGTPTGQLTAASVFPAFVGACTAAEAEALARFVETRLLAPGGLRTTLRRSNQQWDQPNGWAPLQWTAAEGLRRYGHAKLADEIARRWLDTVSRVYVAEGRLLEKYDVETVGVGGGGEYPLQDGFGWTNGVTRAFLAQAESRSKESVQ